MKVMEFKNRFVATLNKIFILLTLVIFIKKENNLAGR